MLRDVYITVSDTTTGDTYRSRSYPDDDYDDNGRIELYNTPVYRLYVDGEDDRGNKVSKSWKALRFMPYWNDPNSPSKKYRSKGWVNAGLHQLSKRAVQRYNPSYGVQNRYSPFAGAIQMRNSFLIHAGPETLLQKDWGWGSAGCVEIVGDFDDFKADIQSLSGSLKTDAGEAIEELVKARKLWVEVKLAKPPKFKSKKYGEVGP